MASPPTLVEYAARTLRLRCVQRCAARLRAALSWAYRVAIRSAHRLQWPGGTVMIQRFHETLSHYALPLLLVLGACSNEGPTKRQLIQATSSMSAAEVSGPNLP